MKPGVTITITSSDPGQPALVYRTEEMGLRGGPATLGGVEGVHYRLDFFVPTPGTLEELLDTIGPG